MPPEVEAPPAPASAPSGPPPGSVSATAAVPPPVEPAAPPKPGSARDRLFSDLRKKAKPANDAIEPGTPPSAPEPKTGAEPEPPKPGEEEGATPTEVPTKPGDKTPKAKVNPWKLVDEYKAKVSTLEKQVAESKTGTISPAEKQAYEERVAKAEARARELDEEIRFVNYAKSEEYRTKYQAPYEKAWHDAMSELSEITVQDANAGTVRQATAEDMLALVQLPLGEAHQLASTMFGEFASEAMAHRKEIKRLFNEQNAALEQAKKSGAERDKTRQENYKRYITEASAKVKEHWDKTNQEIFADPKYGKYFTPVEGDQEGNQRLAKGFELVDRAFSENPMDPSLTAEQRAAIVKRHAAVRNRAAAFGRVSYQLEQARAELAELKKKLNGYQESEPGAGDARPGGASSGSAPGSAKDQVFQELRKRAKYV